MFRILVKNRCLFRNTKNCIKSQRIMYYTEQTMGFEFKFRPRPNPKPDLK